MHKGDRNWLQGSYEDIAFIDFERALLLYRTYNVSRIERVLHIMLPYRVIILWQCTIAVYNQAVLIWWFMDLACNACNQSCKLSKLANIEWMNYRFQYIHPSWSKNQMCFYLKRCVWNTRCHLFVLYISNADGISLVSLSCSYLQENSRELKYGWWMLHLKWEALMYCWESILWHSCSFFPLS